MYVVEKCLVKSEVDEIIKEATDQTLAYLEEAHVLTAGAPVYDTTLRFTLSALWNLTDECPEACRAFVNVGGLAIYSRVLVVGSLSNFSPFSSLYCLLRLLLVTVLRPFGASPRGRQYRNLGPFA